MSATNDLTRGMKMIDTGVVLSVPVGGTTLEQIFNKGFCWHECEPTKL